MIPAGINTRHKGSGITTTELKAIADELKVKAPNAFVTASNSSHLNIVEGETIIGRVEFRNDLGFTGTHRLVLYNK